MYVLTLDLGLGRGVARAVISCLEDRRVLYDPHDVELPHDALQSVFEIHSFLTETLAKGGIAKELADVLRAMEGACRKFAGAHGADDERGLYLRHSLNHDWERGTFYRALGELRGVFGIHIATLAVRYDLDVPDELATILPLDATESLTRHEQRLPA
jgi:hypothetical protein